MSGEGEGMVEVVGMEEKWEGVWRGITRGVGRWGCVGVMGGGDMWGRGGGW